MEKKILIILFLLSVGSILPSSINDLQEQTESLESLLEIYRIGQEELKKERTEYLRLTREAEHRNYLRLKALKEYERKQSDCQERLNNCVNQAQTWTLFSVISTASSVVSAWKDLPHLACLASLASVFCAFRVDAAITDRRRIFVDLSVAAQQFGQK